MADNDSVSKSTKKAMKNIMPEQDQALAAMGVDGEKVRASSSCKVYIVRPLGIGRVSDITGKIQKLEELMKKGIESGKTEMQLIMEANSPVLEIMADIIKLGLERAQPDITIEEIKDGFSLGDFPKVYQKVLDLNDFLSGMQALLKQA